MNINETVVDPRLYLGLKVIWPIIFLLGIFGSVISTCIWGKKIPASQTSTCLLQCCMSIVDTIFIAIACSRSLSKIFFEIDLRVVTGCRIEPYMTALISQSSSLIIIMLCIERVIFIYLPIDAKYICRPKNAFCSFFVCFGLFSILNLPMVIVSKVNEEGKECESLDKNSSLVIATVEIINYLDMSLYSVFPLIVIIITHIAILIKLIRAKKQLNQKRMNINEESNTNGIKNNKSRVNRDKNIKIIKTVVLMAIFHLLFTLPITILIQLKSPAPNLEAVFQVFQVLNHLSHFYIYSSTSTIFISEVVIIMPRLAPVLLCMFRQKKPEEATQGPSTRFNLTSVSNKNIESNDPIQKRKLSFMMRIRQNEQKLIENNEQFNTSEI